jgi:molecular chaperone DnaK
MPQIEVTFDIDANGILKVTAQDKATGRSQHITITASSGLSESEVDKMRKDAESHAEEDRKRKELIEVRNNADNTVYAAEKALREFGDKVPADTRAEVEAGAADVKKAAEGEDVAAIKSATEALGQVIQKIGAAVYQQGSNVPGDGAGGTDGPTPDPNPEAGPDVVEGEVKE